MMYAFWIVVNGVTFSLLAANNIYYLIYNLICFILLITLWPLLCIHNAESFKHSINYSFCTLYSMTKQLLERVVHTGALPSLTLKILYIVESFIDH